MTTYTLTRSGQTTVRSSDGAFIPWDTTKDQPLDIDGLSGRLWRDDGSPKALPYVEPFTADAVKAECARRIFDKASDNSQKNMTANFIAGLLSTEEQQAYKDGVAWITAMQVACRDLITAQDTDYKNNIKWPECPPAAASLAQRL